jgi:CPA1 family monovalent cation:H+ antiporter
VRLTDQLRRKPEQRSCEHVEAIDESAAPRADACEECGVQTSLRVCLSCGHVGCCDSSSGHATAHAHKTGHPVIRALPRGFTYCYPHREYF